MSDMRVKQHPTLGVLVWTDGHVMIPATSNSKAHWTFGSKIGKGYLCVCIDGKHYYVHRLVLEAFEGPCPEGFECNHKNRDRSDNRIENLEWVTPSQNCRNRADNDRVDARGGTHWYGDEKQYRREYRAENKDRIREYQAHRYSENKEKEREKQAQYRQAKRKTHRTVHFSDGSLRWIPNEEAVLLLAIPVKERNP